MGYAFRIAGLVFIGLGLGWLMFRHPGTGDAPGANIIITAKKLDVGMWPEGLANGEALTEFQRQHPGIVVKPWSKFRIPGDFDVASELMSFAARSGPDVTFTYIHRLQFLVDQGFLKRLNPFIGEDENGDGVLEPEEVRWKPWLEIPPVFRRLGMRGADIYALPAGNWFSVMVYRPDIMAAAGLDPQEFPRNFDELLLAGQKICALSIKHPGGRAIHALPRNLEGLFFSLLWSAGGTPGIGDLVEASTGRVIGAVLPEDDPAEKIRLLGHDPAQIMVRWRVSFNDEPTSRTLEALRELCWQPWIVDQSTGQPLNLTEDEVREGRVWSPGNGAWVEIAKVPGGLRRGICEPAQGPAIGESEADRLISGELAMMFMQNNSAAYFGRAGGSFGFAAPPTLDAGGTPGLSSIPMLFGLNGDLSGARLQAGWEFLAFQCGPEWTRAATRYLVENDHLDVVMPRDAERFGYTEALKRMSPGWVKLNRMKMDTRILPYFSGFQQAQTEFFARTVRKISESPDVDIRRAMAEVQRDIEERILHKPGEGKSALQIVVCAVVLLLLVAAMAWGIRAAIHIPAPSFSLAAQAPARWKPTFWLLVVPALASVLVWSYYPAIRGLLLVFQDYRLDGRAAWVGLANFVEGVWSGRFWYTIWNSIQFMGLSVILGFFAPIALAVLLHEIPRGKVFFRTVFFLPSVTSSLVIMLLWVMLYEPTPEGTLNHLVAPLVHLWNQLAPPALDVSLPIRWLQDSRLAMVCVIVPGIWASVGAGCLIYLAALQSISPDLYEASEIDGAGFLRKIRHITIPYLRPLLIINLVGALIGAAHGWNNIFVMTGGGPDLATQVAALEIWMNSFVFLRFGMATAQAWTLGALLMGFVVWQIRLMRKLDFRKNENK